MRIAFISTVSGDPWGGSEELWSQTALCLREQGHAVSASVTWWPELSPKVVNLGKQGVELVFQPRRRMPLPAKLWRALRYPFGFRRQQIAELKRKKTDLVVISQGGNKDGWKWMQLCRAMSLPYVAIVQANHADWAFPSHNRKDIVEGYRGARKIYCVSHDNKELLEGQVGEALPQAGVVWNPFNVPVDLPPPAWPEWKGSWKLASVARLEPRAKGQDLLFKVLSLPRWREREVELNLYGGGGRGGDGLRNMVRELGLSKVHFRGHVDDIRQVWAENHLLVMPSHSEGLPLALVEAMWCGRAAMVTDVGGNAEVCVDGETGFIAAAPTVKSLDRTLERAWARRDEWVAMGAVARTRAEQLIPRKPAAVFCQQLLDVCSHR